MKGLLAVVAGTVVAAAALLVLFDARPGGAIGGPFRLVTGAGQEVTDATFRGRYMLVYFGYTQCRDVCPATLNTMSAALARLGPDAARIQPVFITIDPARDTPAVMAAYVKHFVPGLIGLTGGAAELHRVARAYHVSAEPREGADIDHSAVLYVMAPDGRFLAPVRADASAGEMAAALERLIS